MKNHLITILLSIGTLNSLAPTAVAQPQYGRVTVDGAAMTYGSARITWKLAQSSTSTTAFIQFGTDKNNLNQKSGDRTGGGGVDRGAWLGGLQSNTRYYFRPVTGDSSGIINLDWRCTGTSSVNQGVLVGASCDGAGEPPYFVTPPHPGDAALTPEFPRVDVDTTVPVPTITYPVVTSCSELNVALQRAATDSARFVPAVDLHEDLVCRDVKVPQKTTLNRVLVRVRNADTVLPPHGTRIIEPSSNGTLKLPKFISSGLDSYATASISAFTSCAYGNKDCDPHKVCSSAYCSQGWYFLGIDFTTEDPLPAQTRQPLSLTGVRADGKILKLSIPGHKLAYFDFVLLDQIGGFSQTLAGIFPVHYITANEVWISFPSVITGSWNRTGRAMYYIAQKISTINCTASQDCVVDVGPGNFHGLQSGTIVTPYLVKGLTGLDSPERVSGSYWITRLNDHTFQLGGTAGKVFGTHLSGSGYYFIDHASATLGRFHPDSADIVIARSWIRANFPYRSRGVSLSGDRQAIVDSYIDVTHWVPIDPRTGIPAPQIRNMNQSTPTAVGCTSGEGKKLQNNLIRGHGILVFCAESPENEPGIKMASDITIRGNTFHVPPSLNTSSDAATGIFPRVHFHHRHSFELKRGTRVLVEGNIFEGGYSGEQLNQPMIGFTPRHSKPQDLAANYISDITIRKNIFRFGVTVLTATGTDFSTNTVSPISTRRIAFEQNLVYGMDWMKNRSKPSGPNAANPSMPSSAIGGTIFQFSHYPQDIVIKNNTFFDSRGTGPALMDLYHRVTGLVIEDNLITYHRSAYDLFVGHAGNANFSPAVSLPPTHSLAKYFSDVTGGTGWFRNVVIRATKDASGKCHNDPSAKCNISQSECDSRLGTSPIFTATCFGTATTAIGRFDEVGFYDWEKWNFRRRSDSKISANIGADVTQVMNACFPHPDPTLEAGPYPSVTPLSVSTNGVSPEESRFPTNEPTVPPVVDVDPAEGAEPDPEPVPPPESTPIVTVPSQPSPIVEAPSETAPVAAPPSQPSTVPPSVLSPLPKGPAVETLMLSVQSGTSTVATAVFSHSAGVLQHYLGYILFLPTPNVVGYTAKGSCLIEHNRISNGIRLINNIGDNWLGPPAGVPIGPLASMLINDQCSVDVARTTSVLSGNRLIISVPVTFRAGITPTVATFLQAFDVTGQFTGMTQFGNFLSATGKAKAGLAIAHSSVSIDSSRSSSQTITVGHNSGTSGVAMISLLIAPEIMNEMPCQAFYFPASKTVNLVNDAGSAMVADNGASIGIAGKLSNSRCSIDPALLSQVITGTSITVRMPVFYNHATFSGPKNVYVNAFDIYGQVSHWVQIGSVVIK